MSCIASNPINIIYINKFLLLCQLLLPGGIKLTNSRRVHRSQSGAGLENITQTIRLQAAT